MSIQNHTIPGEVVVPIGAGGMTEAARAPLIPANQPLGLNNAQRIVVDNCIERCALVGCGLVITVAYFTPPVLVGTVIGVMTNTTGGLVAATITLMAESCCLYLWNKR